LTLAAKRRTNYFSGQCDIVMWENTRAQREDRGEGGGGESFLLYGDVKRRTKKRERERE